MIRVVAAALAAAMIICAQQPTAVMNGRDTEAAYVRILQLTESTAISVPDLARASAPVQENIKQAIQALRTSSGTPSNLTYNLLRNVRAFTALSDSLPKPYPMAEEARRQFAELRDLEARLDAHFRGLLDVQTTQIRGSDRDNLRRYAEANAKLAPPAPGKTRVLFYGDSITDGWRLNEYFPDKDYVNRGISGQITGEMLGRMQADVIANRPAAMIILAGTNDVARGVPVKSIENNLTSIAELAEHHKIKMIIASILPVSDYHMKENPRYEMTKIRPPATIRELNTWIQSFAKGRSNITYCNYWDSMIDSAGFLRSELADDGLHPNAAGYRIMAPIAQECIDKAVGAPASAPASSSKTKRK